jgi:hypothetical protein
MGATPETLGAFDELHDRMVECSSCGHPFLFSFPFLDGHLSELGELRQDAFSFRRISEEVGQDGERTRLMVPLFPSIR